MPSIPPVINVKPDVKSEAAPAAVSSRGRKSESLIDKLLGLLSSVSLGITILVTLLVCCVTGMLVMQQNVDGFKQYYDNLMPAQRTVYTMLGLFNIYYSWYFTLLMALLALNIILASIDRFPAAWQYVIKPKLSASPNFIRAQMFNREASFSSPAKESADVIANTWRRQRFRVKVSDENGRITVFGQKGSWNRLGAYVVHIALLTILTGGFLTNKRGSGGMMQIEPGKTENRFITQEIELDGPHQTFNVLPFSIECTDITQQLIKPEGNLEASNTVDWNSYIVIKDKDRGVEQPLRVHLNEPKDYRGYRFFQNAFSGVGYARQLTLSIEPVAGGDKKKVTIPRDGSTTVDGIGNIEFKNFYPDFTISARGAETASGDYNKPVAELWITAPDGTGRRAFAYRAADYSQEGAKVQEALLVSNNRILLESFEKVASSHTLQIQYDPGRQPVYIGFTLLSIALCGVFLFSHQRIWAVVEEDGEWRSGVYFGGNTNRNRPAFEGRFNMLVESAIAKGGGK